MILILTGKKQKKLLIFKRYMAVSQKVQELFSDLRHIGNIYCLNNNVRWE